MRPTWSAATPSAPPGSEGGVRLGVQNAVETARALIQRRFPSLRQLDAGQVLAMLRQGETTVYVAGEPCDVRAELQTALGVTAPVGLTPLTGLLGFVFHLLLSRAELYLGHRWCDPWYLLLLVGCVLVDADKPNLGMSTAEIKERGGVPPSELAERGFFTARFYRDVVSVSIPYLKVEERKAAIARLPKAVAAVKASSFSNSREPVAVLHTVIPSRTSGGTSDASETLKALLPCSSIVSTPHHSGVSVDTGDTEGTAIDEALARGNELTDDQIKYLHLQRRWSPTRIAESRGVRGRKQVRLERVYAALGLRREVTQVEQPV